MHQVGGKKKPRFAAAGTADDQHIFVPGGLGIFGAVVHGEPFRLRQDDVVLKGRGDIGGDVCRCSPAGGAIFHVSPELLGVLGLVIDRRPQQHTAHQPHQQIEGMEAGEAVLERGGDAVQQVQQLLGGVRPLRQPPRLPQLGGKQADHPIGQVGQRQLFHIHLLHRSRSLRFSRFTTVFFTNSLK